MTISMYKASAPIFVQFLNALSGVLDKAAAHAEQKKIDQAYLVTARLYPDMFSLARQVQQATAHAVNACARTAGLEPPALPEAAATLADLKARIAAAVDFVRSLKPAQIDGSEDRKIVVTMASGTREFTGLSYLLNHCLPHFYFHVTTAYDILRHNGVEIGKRDFMGTPVQM
ncbi:MAG TPA: DUF1993 domain-containing protein [Xanthobacteraceae bacterium]|nr:DUF1993 domain-containing protein [Xanthobacteraceae bacterium]